MQTIQDLALHFSDEFRDVADVLKKIYYVKNFKLLNDKGEPIPLDNIADLKAYLRCELDSFDQALDEIAGGEHE